jgi:predicted DNA-binding transcriptional regulator AlpA
MKPVFAKKITTNSVIDVEPAAPVVAKSKPPLQSPYYSRQEVVALTTVCYGSLWAWMRDRKFPLAREIGPGGRRCRIAWLKSEVDDWLANRPQRIPMTFGEAPQAKRCAASLASTLKGIGLFRRAKSPAPVKEQAISED